MIKIYFFIYTKNNINNFLIQNCKEYELCKRSILDIFNISTLQNLQSSLKKLQCKTAQMLNKILVCKIN